MREVGVRELKASLSELLRAAQAGERIRVTAHGRPVAEIGPPGDDGVHDAVQQLVAQGRVTPPAIPLPNRSPRLAKGHRSATAAVLADRESER